MSLLAVAELGTKENPHPITPKPKDRIKGHYYIYKNEVAKWDGYRFMTKQYREQQQRWGKSEKRKEWEKAYGKTEKRKEKQKEKLKRWKKTEKGKESQRKYENKRRKNDPIYKLRQNLSIRTRIALKAQNASKNHRTMEYINCSVAHLHNHIESQFEIWMTWNNIGKYDPNGPRTWQIDHRKPCNEFNFNDEEQEFMCFHWTNLQPLCSKENMVDKNSKFDPKTFRYKWIDRETGWVGIPKYLMNKLN